MPESEQERLLPILTLGLLTIGKPNFHPVTQEGARSMRVPFSTKVDRLEQLEGLPDVFRDIYTSLRESVSDCEAKIDFELSGVNAHLFSAPGVSQPEVSLIGVGLVDWIFKATDEDIHLKFHADVTVDGVTGPYFSTRYGNEVAWTLEKYEGEQGELPVKAQPADEQGSLPGVPEPRKRARRPAPKAKGAVN